MRGKRSALSDRKEEGKRGEEGRKQTKKEIDGILDRKDSQTHTLDLGRLLPLPCTSRSANTLSNRKEGGIEGDGD